MTACDAYIGATCRSPRDHAPITLGSPHDSGTRKVLALVALTIAVVSWRTARAEAEAGAKLHHRVAGTTWLAVGGPPTIGVELSGAHRVVARGIPVRLTYGGAIAHQNFACDSGDACDSHERDLHAGAGFIGCTPPPPRGDRARGGSRAPARAARSG